MLGPGDRDTVGLTELALWSSVIALHDKQVSYKIHRPAYHLGTTYSSACFILVISLASAISCVSMSPTHHTAFSGAPHTVHHFMEGLWACWQAKLSFALIQGFIQGSVSLCFKVSDFSILLKNDKESRINLLRFFMVGSMPIFLGQLVRNFAANPYYKLRKQTQKTACQFYFSSQHCV